MKRWIIVATVLGILLTASAAVWADPINVGGSFCASIEASKDVGPAVYTGKGNPQGVPFQIADVDVLLAPINVGGS